MVGFDTENGRIPIDVVKSSYHQLSQTEIDGDKPGCVELIPCAICCHFGCVIIDPADVPKPSSLVRRTGFNPEVRGCVEAAAFDALSVYTLARPKQRATGGDTLAVGADRGFA